VLGKRGYILYADFLSAFGLHVGDPVEIAGVDVEKVASISLADYRARIG
jgi:ABC-type transporter Mla subunit MlaD